MQYAAFDRGCQFEYHIGKRSEPKSISPDENRQRQAKNKSGMCEGSCVEGSRERAARGGLTKQTQADATRTSFDAFAMAWAASRSLYLAGGVPLVAIFGMRRRRFTPRLTTKRLDFSACH